MPNHKTNSLVLLLKRNAHLLSIPCEPFLHIQTAYNRGLAFFWYFFIAHAVFGFFLKFKLDGGGHGDLTSY